MSDVTSRYRHRLLFAASIEDPLGGVAEIIEPYHLVHASNMAFNKLSVDAVQVKDKRVLLRYAVRVPVPRSVWCSDMCCSLQGRLQCTP